MNKMEEVVVLLGREHWRVLPNNKKASDDGFALTNIQSISAAYLFSGASSFFLLYV